MLKLRLLKLTLNLLMILKIIKNYDSRVVIPKFIDYGNNLKYFIPRFAKIQRGEIIEWTNLDIKSHTLAFYYKLNDEIYSIGKLGPLRSGESQHMTFDYGDVERIDYHCETHPNETGSVIILPKNEESMTNTERLRFLSRIFNLKLSEPYSHLGGSAR